MAIVKTTAATFIASHLMCPVADVAEGRDEHCVEPAVYRYGGSHYCAPTARKTKKRLPNGFNWTKINAVNGRDIYRGTRDASSSAGEVQTDPRIFGF